MRELKFRTGLEKGVPKRPQSEGRMPTPGSNIPKCYFVRRCPWTGYYYAKGSRGSRSNGLWQRAIVGTKWNYYMKNRRKVLDAMPRHFGPVSKPPVVAGMMREAVGARSAIMPPAARIALAAPLREGIIKGGSRIETLPSSGRKIAPRPKAAKTVPAKSDAGPMTEPHARTDSASQRTPDIKKFLPGRMCEEERDIMWFPGISLTGGFPDEFVVDVVSMVNAPFPEAAGAERAPAKKSAGGAPGQTRKTVRRERTMPAAAQVQEKPAEPKRPAEKSARKRAASWKTGRGTARADASGNKPEKTPADDLDRAEKAEVETQPGQAPPPSGSSRKHRPTVSSAEKKAIQLKVAMADDPNLPR